MAIEYVGGKIVDITGWAENKIYLTGLSGGTSTQAGIRDLIVVSTVFSTTSLGSPSVWATYPNGYSEVNTMLTNLYADGVFDTNLRTSYMVLAVEGTSIHVSDASFSETAPCAVAISVWRGVDYVTPLDVAVVSKTITGTPFSPSASVTPVSAGSAICFTSASSMTTGGGDLSVPGCDPASYMHSMVYRELSSVQITTGAIFNCTATQYTIPASTRAISDYEASAAVQVLVLRPATDETTVVSKQSGDWSDPATWLGGVPYENYNVVIRSGHVVTIDARYTPLAPARWSNATIETGGSLVLGVGTKLVIDAEKTVKIGSSTTPRNGSLLLSAGSTLEVNGTLDVYAGTFGTATTNAPTETSRASIIGSGTVTSLSVSITGSAKFYCTDISVSSFTVKFGATVGTIPYNTYLFDNCSITSPYFYLGSPSIPVGIISLTRSAFSGASIYVYASAVSTTCDVKECFFRCGATKQTITFKCAAATGVKSNFWYNLFYRSYATLSTKTGNYLDIQSCIFYTDSADVGLIPLYVECDSTSGNCDIQGNYFYCSTATGRMIRFLNLGAGATNISKNIFHTGDLTTSGAVILGGTHAMVVENNIFIGNLIPLYNASAALPVGSTCGMLTVRSNTLYGKSASAAPVLVALGGTTSIVRDLSSVELYDNVVIFTDNPHDSTYAVLGCEYTTTINDRMTYVGYNAYYNAGSGPIYSAASIDVDDSAHDIVLETMDVFLEHDPTKYNVFNYLMNLVFKDKMIEYYSAHEAECIEDGDFYKIYAEDKTIDIYSQAGGNAFLRYIKNINDAGWGSFYRFAMDCFIPGPALCVQGHVASFLGAANPIEVTDLDYSLSINNQSRTVSLAVNGAGYDETCDISINVYIGEERYCPDAAFFDYFWDTWEIGGKLTSNPYLFSVDATFHQDPSGEGDPVQFIPRGTASVHLYASVMKFDEAHHLIFYNQGPVVPGIFVDTNDMLASISTLSSPAISSAPSLGMPTTADELVGVDSSATAYALAASIAQEHALAGMDAVSLALTSSPLIAQEHVLTSLDAVSLALTSSPLVAQEHALAGLDAVSLALTSSPLIAQEHVLAGLDAVSLAYSSRPAVTQEDVNGARDLVSTGSYAVPISSRPDISQTHILFANAAPSGPGFALDAAAGQMLNFSPLFRVEQIVDKIRAAWLYSLGATFSTDSETVVNDNILVSAVGLGLFVAAVNGSEQNVGVPVQGFGGGSFTVQTNGALVFDPAGEFDSLVSPNTASSSIQCTISDGFLIKTVAVSVTVQPAAFDPFLHKYYFDSSFVDSAAAPLNLTNVGLVNGGGYVSGNGYREYAYCQLNQHVDKYFTYCVWTERLYDFSYYQFILGCKNTTTSSSSGYWWFLNFYGNKIAIISQQKYNVVEPLNVPVFICVVLNSTTLNGKIYRNGVLVNSGTLGGGSISVDSRNIFTICGFTSFSSAYAKSARVYSVEIADRELSAEEIVKLYNRGIGIQ